MAEDYPGRPGPDGAGRLDEIPLPERENLTPYEPRRPRPSGQPQHDDDIPQRGLDQRHDGENEEEPGEADDDVHHTHQHVIDPPGEVSRRRPDDNPDGDGDADSHEANHQGNAGSEEHAGENVAAQVVGAEGVSQRRAEKPTGHIGGRRVVGPSPSRELQAEVDGRDRNKRADDHEPSQGEPVGCETVGELGPRAVRLDRLDRLLIQNVLTLERHHHLSRTGPLGPRRHREGRPQGCR